MKTSNDAMVEFSRDLQQLVDDLGKTLNELSMRPILPGAAALAKLQIEESAKKPTVEPAEKTAEELAKESAEFLKGWNKLWDECRLELPAIDVPEMLSKLQSKLDAIRQRSDLLPTFDRDDPMPWFAEHNSKFDDLPDNYPPKELVDRWRAHPPTSLAAGVLTFAEKCVRHLQMTSASDSLATIGGDWYSVLGLITNGSRFAGWMYCELVDAKPKPAALAELSASRMPTAIIAVRAVTPNDGPVTFDEIAVLASVERKTVQNAVSQWRKEKPDISDPCRYAVVRPFLLMQWPKKSAMFPASYRELHEIIRVRSA